MDRLLLIDTGGTIGMVPGPGGLVPGTGVIERFLRTKLPPETGLKVISFDPLIDSSDIRPADWNRILDLLAEHADWPALVTHGTDTLAFTASALSQAMGARPAPVALCAAMEPVGHGADAEPTLGAALAHLARRDAPGLCVVFDGQALDPRGLVKRHSTARAAFVSVPQDAPVPQAARRFDTGRSVGIVTVAPGLGGAALGAMLQAFDAVVLRIYGSGTFPSDPALVAAVADARAAGRRIRVVSQCLDGGLHAATYAAGAELWAIEGIENGGPETPELAYARLMLA